jgi:signal transduction histidine kinase
MSQVASTVSADDLGGTQLGTQLQLQTAPDEVRGLAQAFNEMLGRLANSWEQQRQFVGNVSHELRTPLTVVSGYLQSVLRRGTNLNDYQREALTTAEAEADRTVRMLQDLLDLARLDNRQLHLRQAPIVLNTLVTEAADLHQRASDRPIQRRLLAEDLVVLADRDRLSRALMNLLDNAVKYSTPPTPIELILERVGDRALVHVRDRGAGIAPEHQERVFERFYRSDDEMTRSRDGTGLGLAIAKGAIEGMNGRISLVSQLGEGSTFTISLPLWRPEA